MNSPPELSSKLGRPWLIWVICPNCHSLPPVGDKLWITVENWGNTVDNFGGSTNEKGVADMKQSYTHTFPLVIHTLYKTNSRTEQGVYNLPTDYRSSYYDYLYIHTSSYANNLSTPHKNHMNYKSRG